MALSVGGVGGYSVGMENAKASVGEDSGAPAGKKRQAPAHRAMTHWKKTGEVPEGYEAIGTGQNAYLRRVRPPLPPPVEPTESNTDRLTAMRFVLVNQAAYDSSEIQRWCRVWLEKSPGAFMARLDELESEEKAKRLKATEGEKPADESLGDRETRELLGRLLDRHAEEANR